MALTATLLRIKQAGMLMKHMMAIRMSAIAQTAAMDMPAPMKTTAMQTMRKVWTKL